MFTLYLYRNILFRGFQQQDSHECLMYILDLLHRGLSYEIDVKIKGEVKDEKDDLMKASLISWKQFYEKGYSCIIENFHGLYYNIVKCKNCDFRENVFEPYNCLSIDINSDELNECLTQYFTEYHIDTWNCSKCKGVGCSKECKIWSMPNYLIIHLKRFKQENNRFSKIDHLVKFPLEDLNLTQHMPTSKGDPNNYIYSLYAVNYHSGALNSGHYWACCKNLDGKWYMLNDGHVSNAQEVMTKDAYMLFYYRKFIKVN